MLLFPSYSCRFNPEFSGNTNDGLILRHACAEFCISQRKLLRMPTIISCYKEEAIAARQESLTHERYLLEVIRRESEQRRIGRIKRFLRLSRLPHEKTMQSFDRTRLPLKVEVAWENWTAA